LWIFCPSSGYSQQRERPAAEYFGSALLGIEYDCDPPLRREHYDPLLGIHPGDLLTRTGLKGAIQALYDTGRFAEISLFAESEAGGVVLRFRLARNYYFNRFRIEGDVDLGGRFPAEVMPLPVGAPFSRAGLEQARREVEKFMRLRGCYLAKVGARTEADDIRRQVDTVFRVEPGEVAKIRSVTLDGVPTEDLAAVQLKLSLTPGQEYRRVKVDERLQKLREDFLRRGLLAADVRAEETFSPDDNVVDLVVRVSGYGRVRVQVEGFKIPRDRLRRLLPLLSGEGVQRELLEEGVRNLREYLENEGYPEAEVTIEDEQQIAGEGVVRYRVESGPKVTVADVEFRGNRFFSGERLLQAIRIRPSRFLQKSVYSISRLDQDVKALEVLYRSAGYLDATIIPLITMEDGADRLRIVFECEEGERSVARAVNIAGNRHIPVDILQPRLQLQPGGVYSPQLAERDRATILAAYNNEGFLQARVSYQTEGPDEERGYSVTFAIEEGGQSFVNRILVLGNERTRESVISSRIRLSENEPLSLSKLLESEQTLYELGIFDGVRVGPQNPEHVTGHQDVVVRITESDKYMLRYGFGYQEREKVRGIFQVTNLGFLGRARRLDLSLRASAVEQAAVISVQQARISYLPVNSYLSVSYSHEEEVSYTASRANFSYQYSHPLNTHSWAIGRFNFQDVRLSDVSSSAELDREDEPRRLSTFSAIYVNDTRDNYFDATRGFFTSTDLGVTTKLLGSNNYLRLYTQNGYHRPLLSFLDMGLGLRIGYLRPYGGDKEVPISERFFVGGPSSLRGFKTDMAGPLDPKTKDPVGGNVLLVANAELRMPIWRFLRAALFYDGGNAFRSWKEISASTFSHAVGIGLRIRTPIGPLRFDYAFNLNLNEELRSLQYPKTLFFFTIGNPF